MWTGAPGDMTNLLPPDGDVSPDVSLSKLSLLSPAGLGKTNTSCTKTTHTTPHFLLTGLALTFLQSQQQ